MNLVSINVGDYTRQGIERMSKVIRASLYARGWTERRLTAEIQARAKETNQPELHLSTGTVNRYASSPPVIKRPQPDVLRAIAPFVFKVVAINGDDIQLDLDHTYEADWREFARIGTTDFEKSAILRTRKSPASDDNRNSGKESSMDQDNIGNGAGAIGRLIRSEMAERQLNPEREADFKEFVRFFPEQDEDDISAMRAIVLGRTEYVNDDLISFVALALRSFTGDERYTTEFLLQLNTAADTAVAKFGNGHAQHTQR